ncbi:MAG: hypothetical protein KJP00_02220 [Bacteroidia bacterium]|nr:hypothetical protein [Bacteroidia bacterium]
MFRILFMLVFLGISSASNAQKILQIEKKNSPKTIKFVTTDIISIRTIDSDNWYSGKIYDFNFEKDAIIFEDRIVFLNDIKALRVGRSGYVNGMLRGLSISMMTFGVNWALLSAIDGWVSEERNFDESDAYLSAGSIATGYLLTKIFSLKTYRMGKKWNFRLLNLNVINPEWKGSTTNQEVPR